MVFRVGVAAAAVAALTVQATSAQVILMNDSTDDVAYVLDGVTGDVIGDFDTSFSQTGINIIDGPDGNLLMSDQTADTVWRLAPDGTLIDEFVQEPVDNIRGIVWSERRRGKMLGATVTGLEVWNRSGQRLLPCVPGDFFDIAVEDRVCWVTDIEDDNVEGYDIDGNLVGRLPPGSIEFPEQQNAVIIDNEMACGVNSFTDATVFIYGFDGRLIQSFPVQGAGRGIVQLPSGNILVTTNEGLFEYTLEGVQVRRILEGTGFRYLEYSDNFQF